MSKLNISAVQAAMKEKGLSGRKLAEKLEISPQTITNWLTEAAFPHPAQLLKLALSLHISFDQLVIKTAPSNDEPRVAARARLNRVLSDTTLAELKGMGKLLEQLAEFLPFDTLESPPRLTAPVTEYGYLQLVSKKVRSDSGVGENEPLKVKDLVGRFSKHNAVLIPVLWGAKDGHENAIHVLLPRSGTTWVYLNLDTYVADFKFWMAHELGHVYSPSLSGAEAEEFANAFAGALLFPKGAAARAYQDLDLCSNQVEKFKVLSHHAEKFGICIYTVFLEANNYATASGRPLVKVNSRSIHMARHARNTSAGTLTTSLWKGKVPTSQTYIAEVVNVFQTPFFETLSKFLKEKERSSSFIQAMLDVPLLDAKALHSELV